MILKSQYVVPFAGIQFFFGEQIRNQESLIWKALESKAEFELAHHIHDKEVFIAGIFMRTQYPVQHFPFQNTSAMEQLIGV